MDALITSVVRLYEQGLSIKAISRHLRISEQKARKILITAGGWSSPLSAKIQSLQKEGKSIDEIAEIIGISHNAVISYLPYDRGMQNAEYPSINAIRIRQCREKRKEEGNG